jgi:hypothetical protein
MKKVLFLLLVLTNIMLVSFAQTVYVDGNSKTRQFIGQETEFNFYRDWSYQAEFTSGIGEYVRFFPVVITNIKTGDKIKALQIEMMVKTENTGFAKPFAKKGETTSFGYIAYEEVDGFVNFLEKNIIPNLNSKYAQKSNEYIFKTKEMIFSYLIYEKERRITVGMPEININTSEFKGNFIYFWTEKNIDDVVGLVKVLKRLKSNN